MKLESHSRARSSVSTPNDVLKTAGLPSNKVPGAYIAQCPADLTGGNSAVERRCFLLGVGQVMGDEPNDATILCDDRTAAVTGPRDR
jgi:hypothetical protein